MRLLRRRRARNLIGWRKRVAIRMIQAFHPLGTYWNACETESRCEQTANSRYSQLLIDDNVLRLAVGDHVHDLLVLHHRPKDANAVGPQCLVIGTVVDRAVEHVLRVVVVAAVILEGDEASPQQRTAAQERDLQEAIEQSYLSLPNETRTSDE